jgi:hypothetical protein
MSRIELKSLVICLGLPYLELALASISATHFTFYDQLVIYCHRYMSFPKYLNL